MVKVSVSIIEAPLALFEMQIKGMIRHTIELLKPSLGKAPEAFNAVDMCRASDRLIGAMVDSEMLRIADIH